MEELLTLAEAAEALRVSQATVRRLIDAGELRGVRVGRLWRVPKPAVEEYLGGDDPLAVLEALARQGGEDAGDKGREIFAQMQADLPGMVERVRALEGPEAANVLRLCETLQRGGDDLFVILGTLVTHDQARRLLRVTH